MFLEKKCSSKLADGDPDKKINVCICFPTNPNQKLDVNGNIWISRGSTSSATNPDGNASPMLIVGDTVALTLTRTNTSTGGLLGFTDQVGTVKARLGLEVAKYECVTKIRKQ